MRSRSASNNVSRWRGRWCGLRGLLLLDEPFSALDAPLRSSLRQEMLALQNEFNATTILVTHDPAEAALLADELLVLEGGRVLQSGPTEQVFSRPASELAARLLGAEYVAEGIAAEADTIRGWRRRHCSRLPDRPATRLRASAGAFHRRASGWANTGRYQGQRRELSFPSALDASSLSASATR